METAGRTLATADNGAAEATVILNSISLLGSGIGSTGTPFPGAQYLDIGLKVKATPRIHPDNEVTLELAFDISSLTTQSFNAIPVISNEAVDQTVRLKENETAVVAGFQETQVTNAITGKPGVADVPVVGLLDQDQNNQHQDSRAADSRDAARGSFVATKDHVIYAGQGSLEGPAEAARPRRSSRRHPFSSPRRDLPLRLHLRRRWQPQPLQPPAARAAASAPTIRLARSDSKIRRMRLVECDLSSVTLSSVTKAWLREQRRAGRCAGQPARQSRSAGPAD